MLVASSSSSSDANDGGAGEDVAGRDEGPPRPRPDPDTLLSLPECRREAVRLRTFGDKWPLPFLHPSRLAKAGFVYLGRGDCVRCVFCG